MKRMSSKKRKLLKYLRNNSLTNQDLNYMVRSASDLEKDPAHHTNVTKVIQKYKKAIHFKAEQLIQVVYLDQQSIPYYYLDRIITADNSGNQFNQIASKYINHFVPINNPTAQLKGFLATEPESAKPTVDYLLKPAYQNIYDVTHIIQNIQKRKFVPTSNLINHNQALLKHYQALDQAVNQKLAQKAGLDKIWAQR